MNIDCLDDQILQKTCKQQHWLIRGCVQGVGFRPFVYRVAVTCGLNGQVWNDKQGVHLLAQGNNDQWDDFTENFNANIPHVANIDSIHITEQNCGPSFTTFEIVNGEGFLESSFDQSQSFVDTQIPPDLAICKDCLAEMLDPNNRRYRYPFINCTHCGPRFTIINKLPYDRPHTSMAKFILCEDCHSEYVTPDNRRFHAQPNACPQCGPTLVLHDNQGRLIATDDTLAYAARKISEGHIVAIKAVGGFQFVCDANNQKTIAQLRSRKQRPDKPFAVMLSNMASLQSWVTLTESDQTLLQSPSSPIVLLPRLHSTLNGTELKGIAPNIDQLGVMLPNSPLHYLLLQAALKYPESPQWLNKPNHLIWVVTSANISGEPLVISNEAALKQLSGIADFFLMHDRDILERCDDSVWQGGGGCRGIDINAPTIIRRARGYTPSKINLPFKAEPSLACGAELKSTVCLAAQQQAFMSQNIGDLSHSACTEVFERTVNHYLNVLSITPERVICDKHPDYFSSHFAEQFAAKHQLPLHRIQHHHAHIGAVLAEAKYSPRSSEDYLGVALDGSGLGLDGTPWGGELFSFADGRIQRIGHFRPLPLPGGDKAAREPWRMALSALSLINDNENELSRFTKVPGFSVIQQMINKELNTPLTTSAGRWFDAVAGLLDNCHSMSYEGQAAMQLESLARQCKNQSNKGWEEAFTLNNGVLDFTPALPHLINTSSPVNAAWQWHQTVIDGLFEWVLWANKKTGIKSVAFGGGFMQNQIIRQGLIKRFMQVNIHLILPQTIPANDAGISLGQIWVSHYSSQ